MRYKMIISYDGSFFHGFQRQPDEISVQQVLEEKLSLILKTKVIIHGAGRTDAFVHAKGQVVHFDSTQFIPCENLRKVLNKHIFPHIYIKDIKFVSEKFHSRKCALKKEYRYLVSINEFDPLKANYMLFFHDRININNIRLAMEYIVGTHDFKSFSKNKITKNTVRTIESFTLNVNNGVLEFSIIGDGFMYNMVRIIVALMLKVGEGRFKPEDIKRILDGKERRLAPFVAAPQGLYLWEVHYDEIYNGSTEPIEK